VLQLESPTVVSFQVLHDNSIHARFTSPVVRSDSLQVAADDFNIVVSAGSAVLDEVSIAEVQGDNVSPATVFHLIPSFGDSRLDPVQNQTISVNLKASSVNDLDGIAVDPLSTSVQQQLNRPATIELGASEDGKAILATFSRDVTSAAGGIVSASQFNASLTGGTAILRGILVEPVGGVSARQFEVSPLLEGLASGAEVFSLRLREGAIKDSVGFFVYPLDQPYGLFLAADDVFSMRVLPDNGIRIEFAAEVYTIGSSELTQASFNVTLFSSTATMPLDLVADPILVTHHGGGIYELDIPYAGYPTGTDTIRVQLLPGTTFLSSNDAAVPSPQLDSEAHLYAPTRFQVQVQSDNSALIVFPRPVVSGLGEERPIDADNFDIFVRDSVSGSLLNVTGVTIRPVDGAGIELGTQWALSFEIDRRVTSQYQMYLRATEMTIFDSRNVSVPAAPSTGDPYMNGEATYSGSVVGRNEVRLTFTRAVRASGGVSFAPSDFTLEIRN